MRKLLNEELDRLSVDAFKEARKLPVAVILDNVRSMNNIMKLKRLRLQFIADRSSEIPHLFLQ